MIINLIDGKFKSAEAKKILLTLLHDKIKYHELEVFSNQERFGTELVNSNQRIKELKQAILALEALLKNTQEADQDLIIKSTIEISIRNDSKTDEMV